MTLMPIRPVFEESWNILKHVKIILLSSLFKNLRACFVWDLQYPLLSLHYSPLHSVANFNVHLKMSSGGFLGRPSSNFLDYENDESVENYFVDARENPGSRNPIRSNSRISGDCSGFVTSRPCIPVTPRLGQYKWNNLHWHWQGPPSQYTTKRTVRKYKSYLLNVNVCNITYSQAVTNPSTKIDGVLYLCLNW